MLVARCFNIAHSEETNSVHYNTGHYAWHFVYKMVIKKMNKLNSRLESSLLLTSGQEASDEPFSHRICTFVIFVVFLPS